MFGLFESHPFSDPQLGELKRSGGLWRGSVSLRSSPGVALAISGPRAEPDAEALGIARSVLATYGSLLPVIEEALYEHYLPYAEAVADGECAPPAEALPRIDRPAAVWPHVTALFVAVTPLDGKLTAEIGYWTTWDEEHTLGARFRNGRLLELCGSVLAP